MSQAQGESKPDAAFVPALWKRVVVSALAWYLALAVGGSLLLSTGIALEFGVGYGAMALGVLMVVGSQMVRSGIVHA